MKRCWSWMMIHQDTMMIHILVQLQSLSIYFILASELVEHVHVHNAQNTWQTINFNCESMQEILEMKNNRSRRNAKGKYAEFKKKKDTENKWMERVFYRFFNLNTNAFLLHFSHSAKYAFLNGFFFQFCSRLFRWYENYDHLWVEMSPYWTTSWTFKSVQVIFVGLSFFFAFRTLRSELKRTYSENKKKNPSLSSCNLFAS